MVKKKLTEWKNLLWGDGMKKKYKYHCKDCERDLKILNCLGREKFKEKIKEDERKKYAHELYWKRWRGMEKQKKSTFENSEEFMWGTFLGMLNIDCGCKKCVIPSKELKK